MAANIASHIEVTRITGEKELFLSSSILRIAKDNGNSGTVLYIQADIVQHIQIQETLPEIKSMLGL